MRPTKLLRRLDHPRQRDQLVPMVEAQMLALADDAELWVANDTQFYLKERPLVGLMIKGNRDMMKRNVLGVS